ncbi:MAG: bacteriohemerythrin [Phycisphaerae bacterium]
MPILTWSESLSVGVDEFDNQHRKLINMINALHDAMAKGQGREILGPLLDALVQYTATHFASEEKRMQQLHYPSYLQHKVEHDTLTRQVRDLKQRFDAGKTTITLEVMKFLREWLTNHIQGTDRKYGPFFAQHQLQGARG